MPSARDGHTTPMPSTPMMALSDVLTKFRIAARLDQLGDIDGDVLGQSPGLHRLDRVTDGLVETEAVDGNAQELFSRAFYLADEPCGREAPG